MIAADIAIQMLAYDEVFFLNDEIEKGAFIVKFRKFRVVGSVEDYQSFIDGNTDFFIAFLGSGK